VCRTVDHALPDKAGTYGSEGRDLHA
jgi:hypothetical protein